MYKRVICTVVFMSVSVMSTVAMAGPARVIRTVATSEEAPAGFDPDTRQFGFEVQGFNDSGVVLYHGRIRTPFSARLALYRDREGIGTEMLVRESGSVPGLPDGVRFDGRLSRNFTNAQLNANGDVLFKAHLAGEGVENENRTALFTDVGDGGLRAIYRSGDHAIGRPAGVRIANFHTDSVVLTDQGQIAFGTSLVGDGINSSNGSALYGSFGGDGLIDFRAVRDSRVLDLDVVARIGSRFETAPGFNDTGLAVFATSLAGASLTSANDSAILMSDQSGLRTLIQEGDTISTLDGDAVLHSFVGRDADLTENGHILINSFVRLPSPSSGFTRAIIRGTSSDNLEIVAQSGDGIEGREGYIFSGIPLAGGNFLHSNSIGQFLVYGLVADENSNSRRAILREGKGDELQAIAIEGDHAVGYEEGVQLLSITNNSINFNDLGQVAFMSYVTGAELALFATDFYGELLLVAGVGQDFVISDLPGSLDTRVVSEINGYSLNNNSEMAVALDFTDGTSGVFVVFVPAPSSALVVSAGLFALVNRRRK